MRYLVLFFSTRPPFMDSLIPTIPGTEISALVKKIWWRNSAHNWSHFEPTSPFREWDTYPYPHYPQQRRTSNGVPMGSRDRFPLSWTNLSTRCFFGISRNAGSRGGKKDTSLPWTVSEPVSKWAGANLVALFPWTSIHTPMVDIEISCERRVWVCVCVCCFLFCGGNCVCLFARLTLFCLDARHEHVRKTREYQSVGRKWRRTNRTSPLADWRVLEKASKIRP